MLTADSNKKFNLLKGYIEFEPQTGLRTNLTMSIVDRSKYTIDLVRVLLVTLEVKY